ncbi:MAG: branched-chain amino acid ABC transporter permease [Chloroflexi bacterium]|nr:branched-chain amino acid ABC transporter permease [Chloroflexota bacterium]
MPVSIDFPISKLKSFGVTALVLIGIGLLAYELPDILGKQVLNPEQHVTTVIWTGSVYSLFALGYALVFSILGVLNLSHSAVFMWGGYIGVMSVIRYDIPIYYTLPLAMLGGGLIGVAVDLVAFAPLRRRNAPRISQLISSLGASAVLVSLAQLEFGTSPERFPRTELKKLPYEATKAREYTVNSLGLDFRITPLQIAIIVIAFALMFLLQYLVARTRTGKAMRVVAFNQKVAGLLSISVGGIFRLTFFLAGALAGAAGVLYALAYPSLTPFTGDEMALKGLTVIVLGGLGSIRGAVLGGILVAAFEVYATAIGYSWLKDALPFVALFLILLFRPQGLLGEANVKRA